jgi:phosphate starvation-inducible membrane PsiE
MKLLEVGSFGGDLAALGLIFLFIGLVVFIISIIVAVVLGIMAAANPDKKYNFKPSLMGILIGILIFIAGGCICGFKL